MEVLNRKIIKCCMRIPRVDFQIQNLIKAKQNQEAGQKD